MHINWKEDLVYGSLMSLVTLFVEAVLETWTREMEAVLETWTSSCGRVVDDLRLFARPTSSPGQHLLALNY